MTIQEVGLYKVGDTVVNFSDEAVIIIEIIEKPPTDRKALGELWDSVLLQHPAAHLITGHNLADDPRSADRVLSDAIYVIEY